MLRPIRDCLSRIPGGVDGAVVPAARRIDVELNRRPVRGVGQPETAEARGEGDDVVGDRRDAAGDLGPAARVAPDLLPAAAIDPTPDPGVHAGADRDVPPPR